VSVKIEQNQATVSFSHKQQRIMTRANVRITGEHTPKGRRVASKYRRLFLAAICIIPINLFSPQLSRLLTPRTHKTSPIAQRVGTLIDRFGFETVATAEGEQRRERKSFNYFQNTLERAMQMRDIPPLFGASEAQESAN
jgi:hypothetical protein